jgi:ADP-dependent NAD(P)H-hydrate dehydratase / NAD(P)H-hydrate epimerase
MYIYSEQEIREADNNADQNGFDVFTLMENAGRALFEEISKKINKQETVLILAGKGNNGGDGIVLARYFKIAGYEANLAFPLGEPTSSIARRHLDVFLANGFSVCENLDRHDCIVDALLGVGAKLPLRDNVLSVIKWANKQTALRIAVDMPTGVEADNGIVMEAFQADFTFSLHGFKQSAFLHPADEYYGEVKALDIGLPQNGTWRVWTDQDVLCTFPKRPKNGHKGTFGTGLLIAGSDEMPGSAMLSGIGAMRSGIGKLVIATSRFASSIICTRLPEATYLQDGLKKVSEGILPEKIKAAAIGPGLEDQELIENALTKLFGLNIPIVVDASALSPRSYPKSIAPVILTPHPGEFSNMIGKSINTIQSNRLMLANLYAEEHGVIVVLKGKYTIIAFPDGTGFVNTTGNTALSKGGSGDTLTGMILSLLCTHQDVRAAVANAVFLHGKCAEVWTEEFSEASMLAGDFSELLPRVLKDFTS